MAVSCGCTPMPVSVAVSGRGVALLVTLSVPVRVPTWVGLKTTAMVQDAPGASDAPVVQAFVAVVALAML